MKTLTYYCAIFLVIGLYSCDKINNPIINKGNTATIPPQPPTRVDSTMPTDDTTLKVLIEDYTAHHCTNCPTGSAQCDALATGSYSKQVVLLQINTSSLAQPYPKNSFAGLPDTAYGNDFTTVAGNNWNNTFIDGDANGMPGTMVGRLYYSGSPGVNDDLYLNSINVSTPFDSLIGVNPVATMHQTVKIHITDSMYVPPASTLSMSVRTTLLAPQAGIKYYLVVALAEDSIFDWQDSLSNDVQYYLKHMTLRAVVNGGGTGWGDSLAANTTPQTMHYVYNSTNFRYNAATITLPPQVPARLWNMAHFYIVAFVYQRKSGKNDYLVLQAQKLHI